MNLKAFISYVELPTKIASVVPFIFGISYSLYKYKQINPLLLLIMFISMICFDMATTAINNYCDYKNELKHLGDKSSSGNPLFVFNISEKLALTVIFSLLGIATVFGIILAFNTNLLILAIGVLCFFVGIFYTYGPIPISRMPLGEIFSGLFMGGFITFITIYINIFRDQSFGIYIKGENITASFNILTIITIGIVALPLITGIANIMLSNNICDLERDIEVNRFTLPYYIGKQTAVRIYGILYYLGYIAIILGMILKILPITCILVLGTFILVNKNISIFNKQQIKSKTFILAIKNFIIISTVYIISVLLGNII